MFVPSTLRQTDLKTITCQVFLSLLLTITYLILNNYIIAAFSDLRFSSSETWMTESNKGKVFS